MMLRNLLTLVLCASFCTVQAQLPNGSTAPDFNLMDLDGNTHVLYDILDDGKSVIIDFSATWCTNCWNYHQTNALDNVYNAYGPDGTNKAQVLWIEADANTSVECITNDSGCSGGTKGDWTVGSDHPYIDLSGDDLSVKSDYQINSFPTIIGIAPNKKQYEIGKLTDSDTWDSWINETFALDYTSTVATDNIDIEVIAGSGVISYLWSNGAITQDLTDISPGTYTCTITEGRGHSIETEDFVIAGNALSLACPSGITTSCESSSIYVTVDEFIDAGGAVTGNIDESSFTILFETSDGATCPETVTRGYIISDVDGATTVCEQIITVEDTEAPTVIFDEVLLVPESELAATIIESYSDFENRAISVSDNCEMDPTSLQFISEIQSNQVCNEYTRVYVVADLCGNTTTATQIIYLELDDNAQLSVNATNEELTVSFQSVSNFDDIIESYLWDFGGQNTSTLSNPEFTFPAFGTYNVCLTVGTENCGLKTICEDIEVKMPSNTQDDLLQTSIEISPIPATDFLKITSLSDALVLTKALIYDVDGKVVSTITQNFDKVDLTSFSEGMYFVEIQTASGFTTMKIVKL
ncbi:T9SS type A sorting domain-containing protein [Saprospiraceae bacterium]|nr:T9SS type A sorting domain-containing protein [Saprospiraceae bacterium]